MPSSIPFEAFLHEHTRQISLKEADRSTTMTWFVEGGLRPTDQARGKLLDPLFTVTQDTEYRELPEKSLTRLDPHLKVRGFLREVFRWQYPDEGPTVERLQRVLRSHGQRFLSPLEMMHVLWSRPWEQNLFGGMSHFSFFVAMQECSAMDEALIFRYRRVSQALPLGFDVTWDDFCCMKDFEPQTILYTAV